MKVRIIRPTIAQKRQAMPGEELDVSKQEGIQLVGAGKAIVLKDVEVENTDMPTADVETSTGAEPATAEPPAGETEAKPKRTKVKKVS